MDSFFLMNDFCEFINFFSLNLHNYKKTCMHAYNFFCIYITDFDLVYHRLQLNELLSIILQQVKQLVLL